MASPDRGRRFLRSLGILPRVLDHLQVYPFWLIDLSASPFGGNAFTPTLGFQACTSPEITLDMADIKEGNWFYPHHFIRGATVGSITLSRGVQFFDSDFYKWVMLALQGQGVVKRDLLLIHYFAISPLTLAEQAVDDPGVLLNAAADVGAAGAMMAKIVRAIPADAAARLGGGLLGGVAAGALSSIAGVNSPVEFAPRFPAKAWMLRGCKPMRWKSTGDFDAGSGDVSIAELEVQPHMIEELAVSNT